MKIKIDFFIQKLYYTEFEIYFKCNIKQEKYIFMFIIFSCYTIHY